MCRVLQFRVFRILPNFNISIFNLITKKWLSGQKRRIVNPLGLPYIGSNPIFFNLILRLLIFFSYVMVLSKNRITLLALFRSFNALFALFLIYPEVFFYYISRQISTPFFITDSNILAARYFSGVLFFLYVYFLPFFFVFSIFWVIPSCSQFTHDLRLRLSILAVYFHLITVFFNHFDLSDFDYNPIISVFSNSRGMDFSSFTSQYRGTY